MLTPESQVPEKSSTWFSVAMKYGAATLIALYLVYSNNEIMRSNIEKINESFIRHEETTRSMTEALRSHEAMHSRVSDGQLRLLRVICRNTATDIVQRNNCDNN